MSRIYLDFNAGAPLRPEVAHLLAGRAHDEIDSPANPSSVHGPGQAARARLTRAREELAQGLGCEAREVSFTSSGTEANAWAVRGAFLARRGDTPSRHEGTPTGRTPARVEIVASTIEHPALLQTLRTLEREEGARLRLIPPDADGAVRTEAMDAALGENTALCTLMWVNNETGVIQPIEAVGRRCEALRIPFHVDAVQAVGKVPLSLRELPHASFSFASHKLGGPAGMGALVARTAPLPLIPGHQERGLRGGTPWVAGAEAFALAVSLSLAEAPTESARLLTLRARLEQRLHEAFADVHVNGAAPRVSSAVNFRVPGSDAESWMMALDLDGIAVSTGAACASGSLEPSHVLLAMGLRPEEARSSLRISMGRTTQEAHVDALVERLRRLPRSV